MQERISEQNIDLYSHIYSNDHILFSDFKNMQTQNWRNDNKTLIIGYEIERFFIGEDSESPRKIYL